MRGKNIEDQPRLNIQVKRMEWLDLAKKSFWLYEKIMQQEPTVSIN